MSDASIATSAPKTSFNQPSSSLIRSDFDIWGSLADGSLFDTLTRRRPPQEIPQAADWRAPRLWCNLIVALSGAMAHALEGAKRTPTTPPRVRSRHGLNVRSERYQRPQHLCVPPGPGRAGSAVSPQRHLGRSGG